MRKSADLLTIFEPCNRAGFWARDWQRRKMDDIEMLQAAIHDGLTTSRKDYGEAAGEATMGYGAEPGLHASSLSVYDSVVNLSCLADVLVSAIRKSGEAPWKPVEPIQIGDGPTWYSGAYLSPDASSLRRIAITSNWSDDKHYSFARSWFSLGESAIYGIPLQQATLVIGSSRDGKRHGYWTKGWLHPVSKKLRFRKRHDRSSPFKESWNLAWREDHDELSTKEWLQMMYEDSVLQDVCFAVPIPVPEKSVREKIRDLAARRIEQIYRLNVLPPQQLSTCDWPTPCAFRNPCHSGNEPNGRYGFVPVGSL